MATPDLVLRSSPNWSCFRLSRQANRSRLRNPGATGPALAVYPTHINRRKALFEEALQLVSLGITFDITAFPVGPQKTPLAQTVQELLGKGLTLGQILPPFTSIVARVLRLSGKGRLAVGTDADLVVLESEGSVGAVMANGRWQVEQGRAVIRGTFEEASR